MKATATAAEAKANVSSMMSLLTSMSNKLDKFDTKLENLDKKFDKKFENLDKKFDKKFDELSKDVNSLKMNVRVIMVLGSVIATGVTIDSRVYTSLRME